MRKAVTSRVCLLVKSDMRTTVEVNEGQAVVTFEGRMESHIIHEVVLALKPVYELKDTDVTFDCTKLEYISSNGFRLLQVLIETLRPNGCRLYIKGASDKLMSVFKMTGFDKCFFFI